MMGDAKLTTTKATYYPPSLLPGYKGKFIPVKHGYGSLFEGARVNYFQDHRNESFSMPSADWGRVSTIYSPKPDLVAVENIVKFKRILRKPEMPLSTFTVDRGKQQAVDDFFMVGQLFRDHYKDHTGHLHPNDYFRRSEYLWQCSPDISSVYNEQPQHNLRYRPPPGLPLTMERSYAIPPLPQRSLAGRHFSTPDSIYKT